MFWASAAILIIEVLGVRLLAPYLGVSLQTYTASIGVVLAGISAGNALGGRLADHRPPRRVLAVGFAAGGLLVIVGEIAVAALGPVLLGGPPLAMVTLAAAGLLGPCVALGMVTPAVAKEELQSLGNTGRVVGGLSSWATSGALVGTFGTGFVLVRALPTRPALVGLGVALLATAVAVAGRRTRRLDVAVLILVLGLLGVIEVIPPQCDVETAYVCAHIERDPTVPTGRRLKLDRFTHSFVDIVHPRYLQSGYQQVTADLLDELHLGDRPRFLHLGGAGFTMPRYVRATWPQSVNVVLERDPELVGLAQRELGLHLDAALRVSIGDAALTIDRQPRRAFNVVLADAFGGLAAPWQMMTSEFVGRVRARLRPDGVYVLNLLDAGRARFVKAEVATLRRHFASVIVVPPPGGGGNFVVAASDRSLDGLRVTAPSLTRTVWSTRRADAFAHGARVLRDDFAPVDQLIDERYFYDSPRRRLREGLDVAGAWLRRHLP